VLGEPRSDRHLRAAGPLALADEPCDVLRQGLGLERRLAEHNLSDRLVDDLLEARHVRALLVGAELDDALEPRREQLHAPVWTSVAARTVLAQPDHLLDPGHADLREAELERGRPCLDVHGGCVGALSGRHRWLTG